MSQSFSLYTELTVRQNLELHARLFHLPPRKAVARLAELVEDFGLQDYLDQETSELPLGIRQRLSLAVAVVHEPEILILDEPTSGVDPLARDRFWELLIDLSRNKGVTIFVSTHFMNEAERCDRISLMNAGRVLATDTPANLVRARGAASLEDAFIRYLEEATGESSAAPTVDIAPAAPATVQSPRRRRSPFSLQRLLACTIREAIELVRDPIRLGFALFGTTFLMLVFGFGISTDVNNLTFAVLDHDQTHESRAYLEELRGSSYFLEKPPLNGYVDLHKRLQSGDIDAAVEIPPGFGRDLEGGRPAWVGAWVDGAMPFRAETIRGYLEAMHQLYLADPAVTTSNSSAPRPPARLEIRYKYNQDFDSVYAQVPSTISMLLALFPAILMAVAIVREKELGSITNLYVTPVTRIEFLLGKQLPYIGVATANFALMFLMAIFVFRRSAQRQLSGAVPRRADLRHGDDRHRDADIDLLRDADCRDVRHRHPDGAAGNAVRRSAGAGEFAVAGRANHGTGISHDVLPADRGRHVHQGARLSGPFGEPSGAAFQLSIFRPGSDRSSASCSCASRKASLRGAGAMNTILGKYLLARHQGAAQLYPAGLRAGRARHLRVLARKSWRKRSSYSQEVHSASIAIVDEDHSELSRRIGRAVFMPPLF